MLDRLIGLIFFIIGIAVLLWTYYYPASENDGFNSDAKGYIGGIGFIILALMLLFGLEVWK